VEVDAEADLCGGGCIGRFVWRWRQRQIEAAAKADLCGGRRVKAATEAN